MPLRYWSHIHNAATSTTNCLLATRRFSVSLPFLRSFLTVTMFALHSSPSVFALWLATCSMLSAVRLHVFCHTLPLPLPFCDGCEPFVYTSAFTYDQFSSSIACRLVRAHIAPTSLTRTRRFVPLPSWQLFIHKNPLDRTDAALVR